MRLLLLFGLIALVACVTVSESEKSAELANELSKRLSIHLKNYEYSFTLYDSLYEWCNGCHHTRDIEESKEQTYILVKDGIIEHLARNINRTSGSVCNGGCLHTTINTFERLNNSTQELCSTVKDAWTNIYGRDPSLERVSASEGCHPFKEKDIDTYMRKKIYGTINEHNWTVDFKAYESKLGECYVVNRNTLKVCFDRFTNQLSYANWTETTYYWGSAARDGRRSTQTIIFQKVRS